MELAREQAILAQDQKVRDNKKNAVKMKIAANERLDERSKNLQELFEKKVVTVG